MRTQSEIKKNNIRKANLLKEYNHRNNKGNMATSFGLYEQCRPVVPSGGRDTEGVYMGAPVGTEPEMPMPMDMGMDMGGMDMMGMDMGDMDMMDMNFMDDDDVIMDDNMMMMIMQEDEDENLKPDFLDFDGDGDKKESMKKALKDKKGKMTEKSGCGSKRNYSEDYEKIDHDRGDFDGRASKVVGVDIDDDEQSELFENYKALSAKPTRDAWGNKFNNILTESRQVNGINSLMNRMKKVIR